MPRQIVLYLAGPMTGYPGLNFPAFREAAARYRSRGFIVLDPSENAGGLVDIPREVAMRLDIQHLLAADAVVALKGWRNSRGARLEVAIADELGIPVVRDVAGWEFMADAATSGGTWVSATSDDVPVDVFETPREVSPETGEELS